ncbi:hypothetical protein P3S67_006613 [Capsicum chacoense]
MLPVASGRWIDAEIKKMRALIKRLFAELNARQDKFDEAILELKASIESLKDQENGGKGVKSAMNALSALQVWGVWLHSSLLFTGFSGLDFQKFLVLLCAIYRFRDSETFYFGHN